MIINTDTNNGNNISDHKQIISVHEVFDRNKSTEESNVTIGHIENINNITNSNFITQSVNILDIVKSKPNISQNDNKSKIQYIIDHKYRSRVCNTQFRLNVKQNNLKETDSETVTPKKFGTKITVQSTEICNDSPYATPINVTRTIKASDVDDMSEINVHPMPRGIVNPNYPGFQHLAHTLQDYNSTNIVNLDTSDNDMTDDDIDVDQSDPKQKSDSQYKHVKNINYSIKNLEACSEDSCLGKMTPHFVPENQLPDLLKTISNNNNNNNDILISCTATDIENNFNTKDIIGDFNKEIEDEIRLLLNYNINIEDDLQELRNDIKDTFAKPIENTINNISEVVNDVIKKLIENDVCDKRDIHVPLEIETKSTMEIDTVMKAENETNARTELNISRPTFLLLENNTQNKITDAILSDGKEEINVCEYNTEHLSYNVENTLKQLSTELRKIIPKLNEIRERDKIWTETKKELPILTDDNSNNILHSSVDGATAARLKLYEEASWRNLSATHKMKSVKIRNDTRSRQITAKIMSKVKTKSVLRDDYIKDYEFDSFDVYNIETALPKLDFDTIENHIKAAKDAERRKRNDREEIRKRLAMDAETEEYYSLGHTDRPGRKPSLHSRLQNGKNLQICFMNETASDNESQTSELERTLSSNSCLSQTSLLNKNIYNNPYHTRPLSVNITKSSKISNTQNGSKQRPTSLTLKTTKSKSSHSLNNIEIKESDFFALQATLQTEARIALAQAKEMARVQMERERVSRGVSPVTEMLRRSVAKARVPLTPPRRRLSRHLLTDVNVTQLQVIVNELHSQIEGLNDTLVKLLMARDELHMGQDSMLVDIEDLTRYLGVKEQTKKIKGTTAKSGVRRLTSLVHK